MVIVSYSFSLHLLICLFCSILHDTFLPAQLVCAQHTLVTVTRRACENKIKTAPHNLQFVSSEVFSCQSDNISMCLSIFIHFTPSLSPRHFVDTLKRDVREVMTDEAVVRCSVSSAAVV